MPFAELPGSHIQGLQTPDWTRFAAQANEMIAHQPIPDTAGAVGDAVRQIDEILKMSSPEARLERQVKNLQLHALGQMYQDYQANPNNYKIGANGLPIHIDPVENALKWSQIKRNIALAGKDTAGGAYADALNNLRAKDAEYRKAIQEGKINLPPGSEHPVEPVSDNSSDAAQPGTVVIDDTIP